ncbi:unnamed protein product [Hermetia illucens]|uniref:CCHC-type domain-containing protein n=1 Tax=Hermetia illucens TaxID=343691 RepID=A0A7R8UZ24_HERIL|nr:unnamed protein product [Hermetia illucens]
MTYADILRKVKSDPELMDLGENVSRIRRSQKGDLMLELEKSPGKTVENFFGKVEKSLGEEAQVRARKQELVIECKDIDEITTKEDIRDALEKQFGPLGLQDSAIRGLRKAYGGTQTATISLPTEAAFKLLVAGKVKIGWVVCRLREQVSLKRCFRCLEFGHIAAKCIGDCDRSKCCRKCGGEGHMFRECKAEPECMLCKENKSGNRKLDASGMKGFVYFVYKEIWACICPISM